MTFLVEDGTGLPDSTSYTSVQFALDYLGPDWAPDVAAQQKALEGGTEYADLRWGKYLRGEPLLTTQALEFPRKNIYDRYGTPVTGIPFDLQRATALYAEAHYNGVLYYKPGTEVKGISRRRVVVGPVTKDESYGNDGVVNVGGSIQQYLSFPQADRYMSQYALSSNRVVRN